VSDFTYRGLDLGTDPFGNVSTADEDNLVVIANIALWSDARADDDVEPPDGTQNRRGFWADTYEDDGLSTGSLLWTLDRNVLTQTERNLAKDFAEQALEFMVTIGLAAEVVVTVEDNERQRLDLFVSINQDDGTTTAITYQDLWTAVR